LVGVQEERWSRFLSLVVRVGDPVSDGSASTIGEVRDCCCLEVQSASLDGFQFGVIDPGKGSDLFHNEGVVLVLA
jgi:hypothetical protein